MLSVAVAHDAVVGAACAGAAGAGAVAAQHLRGGPAVQLHRVTLGAAPAGPGVTEMMTEPVRVHGHPALAAPPGDHLVDAVRRHRPPVVHPQPQMLPPGLGMAGAGPDVAVQAAGGLAADPDNPRPAALAPDRDLPLALVQITTLRILGVVADPGKLREPDASRLEHGDDRGAGRTTAPGRPVRVSIVLRW